MFRRILVPIDGSPTAQRGLNEAVRFAKAIGASLVMLHITEDYPVMMEMATTTTWERVADALRTEGKRILDHAQHAAQTAGIAYETQLADTAGARVCDVIVARAVESGCDLIVMGTHGRRGVKRALIGSDAERVAHVSPVPVLLLRDPEPA